MVSDGGGGAGRQGARLGGCSGSESQAPVRPLGVMTGLAGAQAGEGAAQLAWSKQRDQSEMGADGRGSGCGGPRAQPTAVGSGGWRVLGFISSALAVAYAARAVRQ